MVDDSFIWDSAACTSEQKRRMRETCERKVGRLNGVGALWDCVPRVCGSGGAALAAAAAALAVASVSAAALADATAAGCAGGGVPLGAVPVLSWCGKVSLGASRQKCDNRKRRVVNPSLENDKRGEKKRTL